jgi:predicted DNA-binding protein with PD1-like motif
MQSKMLHEDGGKRTFAVILQKGDEAMHCLQQLAIREGVGGAQITAIGGLSSAKLAFFDWETKEYRPIAVEEQVEVASLIGDIAVGTDRQPSVHVHAVLGRRDGTALAGHLLVFCPIHKIPAIKDIDLADAGLIWNFEPIGPRVLNERVRTLEGYVRPTLEIIITEAPAHLCKVKDPESGLALIRV